MQKLAVFETQMIKSFDRNNASTLYSYINRITGHNSSPTSVMYGSSTATSDADKASLFNLYFHSVFCHSSYLLPSLSDIPNPPNTCSDIVITEEEVFSILSTLDTSKAVGHDKIGLNLLRHCALALSGSTSSVQLVFAPMLHSHRLAFAFNHSNFEVR